MIAGSGDGGKAAGRRGNGRLRVSRGDREQVIESLKAAFVDDRLTKEELDARVGQALASRTRAELAVVTADLSAAPQAGQPSADQPQAGRPQAAQSRGPVRSRGGVPASNAAKAGIAVAAAVAVATVLAFATSIPPAFLFIVSFFFAALLAGGWMLMARDEERSPGQLPPPPDPDRPAKRPLQAR